MPLRLIYENIKMETTVFVKILTILLLTKGPDGFTFWTVGGGR